MTEVKFRFLYDISVNFSNWHYNWSPQKKKDVEGPRNFICHRRISLFNLFNFWGVVALVIDIVYAIGYCINGKIGHKCSYEGERWYWLVDSVAKPQWHARTFTVTHFFRITRLAHGSLMTFSTRTLTSDSFIAAAVEVVKVTSLYRQTRFWGGVIADGGGGYVQPLFYRNVRSVTHWNGISIDFFWILLITWVFFGGQL